jgi:predicted nucleotidyltransferase
VPAGLISAYLFGSHAKGRAHRESDVDVAVLLAWERYPTAKDRFEARVRLGAAVGAALRCARVDLVVLNDVPPALGQRIVTTGDPAKTYLVERLVELRRHLDHLGLLRPRVTGREALDRDLSLHNDVLFSLSSRTLAWLSQHPRP